MARPRKTVLTQISVSAPPSTTIPGTPEMGAARTRRTNRVEDIAWMAETGETVPGVAARLGVHPQTVRDFLHRAGRRDLLARLLANQDDRPYAGPHASTRRIA